MQAVLQPENGRLNIVLSTCSASPDLTASDALLAQVLEQRGHCCSAWPWNSSEEPEFASVDAVCLRANWDYHEAPHTFLSWLERLQQKGVRVLNEPDLVRWNFDKRYLGELREKLVDSPAAAATARDSRAAVEGGAAARLHIPDFHVVDPRNTDAIVSLMTELGWEKAVLKPVNDIG